MVDFEKEKRELIAIVEKELPSFVEAVELFKKKEVDVVMMHQDAFAGAYQTSEYLLLGMAIKYAGLCGASVMFIGSNRETYDTEKKEV